MMPTLRDLTTALGPDLTTEGSLDVLDREVSGVHISELSDPTAYLSGGELLLTTGMRLSGHTGQARAYIARLVDRGISGLGFGLGPVHDRVPTSLIRACESAGLPLFSIPAPTPFLVVSRAYWNHLVAAGRAELSASLDVHRELIRALHQHDSVAGVVRILAEAAQGWAARLDPEGRVVEVWPPSRLKSRQGLTEEVQRLRDAGPHASATFPLGEDGVVVQPLSRGRRVVGFVATGAARSRDLPDRQLVLAACVLLTLVLDRQHQALALRRTERSCILALALNGHLDAARALNEELGHDRLPPVVRLIAAGPVPPLSGPELAERWERSDRQRPVWLMEDENRLWIMADPVAADEALTDLRVLGGSSPELRATASPDVPLTSLAGQRMSLRTVYARCLPGAFVGSDPTTFAGRAAEQLEVLEGHGSSDLVGAVATYLRHRGHWERAAKTLGVHRNTLRQRIGVAQQLAELDLADPDQASHLWLALRDRGVSGTGPER